MKTLLKGLLVCWLFVASVISANSQSPLVGNALPTGAFIVTPTLPSYLNYVDAYGRTNWFDYYYLTPGRVYDIQVSFNARGTNWLTSSTNGTWTHSFKSPLRPEPLGIGGFKNTTTRTWFYGPFVVAPGSYFPIMGRYYLGSVSGNAWRVVDWTDAVQRPNPFINSYYYF